MPTVPPSTDHRERLGIPADAEQVVVVAESTHWDPNWLLTSTEYLHRMVAPVLDAALDELAAEPRRVFSLECTFYPARYWELRPERRDAFRDLTNAGRLRFTGSGVTTPDTLLPEDEALLRDLVIGGEWLRTRDLHAEPRVLYLPDSFGHTPGLPALLDAAGVPYAAICRIDGMRFPGAELERASNFPVPDTSAHRLTEERTADFVWRGADGSEVLTHWHAFGYGHGDLLASSGLTRAMGLPLAWPSRGDAKVAARVERFVAQLATLARTPYLLLALGLDFTPPIPRLLELLDTWNAHGYPRTGIWLVNAALDDYFDLLEPHRHELPSIELDPNPYWTGFYATRPGLKRAVRDLGHALIVADHARVERTLRGEPDDATATDALASARWTAATANHHDFVTGTAPDRVARREQWPWLVEATRRLRPLVAPVSIPTDDTEVAPPRHERSGDVVTVTTATVQVCFDESRGGAIVSATATDGTPLAGADTLELAAHAERGGLWRMGMEFPGGRWQLADTSTRHPARVRVRPHDGGARVSIAARLDGRPAHLTVDVSGREAALVVRASTHPRLWRTITLRGVDPAGAAAGIAMHQPGGVVDRPLQRRYTPTYWPLHSWATLTHGEAADDRLTVATAVPTALHVTDVGDAHVVVARNAPRELAWGVVPLLGPAAGYEPGAQRATLALGVGRAPDRGRALVALAAAAAGRWSPDWLVVSDRDDVEVLAVKVAGRGPGIIVRLRSWAVTPCTVTLGLRDGSGAEITQARRCDAAERDGEELAVHDATVRVPVQRHLSSVRLLTRSLDAPRG